MYSSQIPKQKSDQAGILLLLEAAEFVDNSKSSISLSFIISLIPRLTPAYVVDNMFLQAKKKEKFNLSKEEKDVIIFLETQRWLSQSTSSRPLPSMLHYPNTPQTKVSKSLSALGLQSQTSVNTSSTSKASFQKAKHDKNTGDATSTKAQQKKFHTKNHQTEGKRAKDDPSAMIYNYCDLDDTESMLDSSSDSDKETSVT